MLISIDHGNKQVKTIHHAPFTSGLVCSEVRPFGGETLTYQGQYYTLTDQRIPNRRDKTEDERFFVLTLFAVAYELEAASFYGAGPVRVQLAVGLPPAHYGAQQKRFAEYFLNRGAVSFTLHDRQYEVLIDEVSCYPQSYAAAVTIFQTLQNTNWDGMFKSDPVGLRNYIRIFSDPNFWTLLKNTGVFLLTIPVQALIGMIIAVILNDRIPGWRFFRLVYYLPSIISMTVVGLLYKIMFSYSGPLNEVLRAIGLDALAIEWLNSGPSARFVVFLCLVWSNIGWQVLIIFGGLTGIDPSILEAATIDGAGYWRRLFSITIPLLARTLEYSFVSAMIWIFTGIFPLIYSLSNGGPGYETTTLDYMVYVKGFNGTKLGQACALSVILLLIITAITVIQMRMSNRADDWR